MARNLSPEDQDVTGFGGDGPGIADGFAINALSGLRVAIAYVVPEYWKNAGANVCICAVPPGLTEPLLFTTTVTGPTLPSEGACTLICVGLT